MPNSTWISIRDAAEDANSDHGGGAGSALNPAVLISAGVATIVATVVSVVGILFQLKVSKACQPPYHLAMDPHGLCNRTIANRYYNGTCYVGASPVLPSNPMLPE